jgi:regulator of replication initiation timing
MDNQVAQLILNVMKEKFIGMVSGMIDEIVSLKAENVVLKNELDSLKKSLEENNVVPLEKPKKK